MFLSASVSHRPRSTDVFCLTAMEQPENECRRPHGTPVNIQCGAWLTSNIYMNKKQFRPLDEMAQFARPNTFFN